MSFDEESTPCRNDDCTVRLPLPSFRRWQLSRSPEYASAIYGATSFCPNTTFVISEVCEVMTVAPLLLRRQGACDALAALLTSLIAVALMHHNVNLAPTVPLIFAVVWLTVGNLHRFWWLSDEEAAARWRTREVRTQNPSLNCFFDAKFGALEKRSQCSCTVRKQATENKR